MDEADKAVPGVKLGYSKLAEYARDKDGRRVVKELGFSRAITAGADGRFVLPGLPPGKYSVCALAAQPGQLGSCDWGGVPVVLIAAGQRVENLTRTVWDGTVLTIRVSDPSSRIALPDSLGKVTPERRFFIGACLDSGFYRRAELVSQTATEYVFRVTVPRRRPVRLFIDSDLRVTDQTGRPVETKRPATQELPAIRGAELTVQLRAN
jgi:hypothetical protein